jgi:hypothetical protein
MATAEQRAMVEETLGIKESDFKFDGKSPGMKIVGTNFRLVLNLGDQKTTSKFTDRINSYDEFINHYIKYGKSLDKILIKEVGGDSRKSYKLSKIALIDGEGLIKPIAGVSRGKSIFEALTLDNNVTSFENLIGADVFDPEADVRGKKVSNATYLYDTKVAVINLFEMQDLINGSKKGTSLENFIKLLPNETPENKGKVLTKETFNNIINLNSVDDVTQDLLFKLHRELPVENLDRLRRTLIGNMINEVVMQDILNKQFESQGIRFSNTNTDAIKINPDGTLNLSWEKFINSTGDLSVEVKNKKGKWVKLSDVSVELKWGNSDRLGYDQWVPGEGGDVKLLQDNNINQEKWVATNGEVIEDVDPNSKKRKFVLFVQNADVNGDYRLHFLNIRDYNYFERGNTTSKYSGKEKIKICAFRNLDKETGFKGGSYNRKFLMDNINKTAAAIKAVV